MLSRLPPARPALSAPAPHDAFYQASGDFRRWKERRKSCLLKQARSREVVARSAWASSAGEVASSSTSAGAAARGRRRRNDNNHRGSSHHHYQHSPESVLAQCESLWPGWAAAGCRLEAETGPAAAVAAVGAPTPDQAAAGLRAAADAAARLPAAQRELLATDRRVRGLVECLRVTRPRGRRSRESEASGSGGGGDGSSSSSPPSLSAEAAPDAAVGLSLLGGREGAHDEALAAVLRLAVSGEGEGGGGGGGGAGSSSSSSSSSPSPSSLPPSLDLHPAAAADLLRAMAIARYADKEVLTLLDEVLGAATRKDRSKSKNKGSGGSSGSERSEPSPSDVSAALWAFAVLQHQPEALLAGDGEERGGEESPVAALLASAASAAAGGGGGASPPAASGFRSRRAPPSPSSYSATAATAIIRPRDLASSLWALAALGRVRGKAFAAGWRAALALGRKGMAHAGEAGLSQLHLAGAAANLFIAPPPPTGSTGGSSGGSGSAVHLRGGWVARPGSLPRVSETAAAAAGEQNEESDEKLLLLTAAAEQAWQRASALRAGAASSKSSSSKRVSSSPSAPSTLQRQVVSSLSSILGRGGAVVSEEGVCPVTWLPVDALVPARRLAKAQQASSSPTKSSTAEATTTTTATTTATTTEEEEEELKPSPSSSPSSNNHNNFPFLGLALEVDGPLHDLRGPDGGPGVPTGGTALKRRLLAAAGWAVVVVGHREWSEAGSGVAARQMLLRKLEEAGVV